jgi:hypothetical protein
VPHRFLGRELGDRLLGGTRRVVDGARDVASDRRGLEEVMRERRHVRVRSRAVEPLERFAGRAMAAEAVGGAELLVERVAHEDVREAMAGRRVGDGRHEPGRDASSSRREPVGRDAG